MRKQLSFIALMRFLMIIGCLGAISSKTYAQCENPFFSVDAGEAISVCSGTEIQLSGFFEETIVIPLMDINQSVNNTCMASFGQVDLAQSFTAVSSTSCGAGLTFTTNTTSTVSISLWTNLPNAGGVQLAIGTACRYRY
jgi:hypothetical protein